MSTKDQLRKKYKALRKNLSDEIIENKSIQIANQTLQLPIWELQNFHLFLSIVKQKEIDTEPLLHLLSGKDKNIIVSKSNFTTGQMQHFLLTDNTRFQTNRFGIPEPEDGIPFPENNLDVVFVPLLAYDQQGNRIGYGKGFYDRFLARCRPDCIKIGLSLFEHEPHPIAAEAQDIRLDYTVTPERVYRFV